MPRQHGPWTIRESHQVYRNPFIEVVEDRVVRPDGHPGIYGTVTMMPGVAVLPVDEEGMAYLTREFRYAIGRESIEVAGGGIDEGESPAGSGQAGGPRRTRRRSLRVDRPGPHRPVHGGRPQPGPPVPGPRSLVHADGAGRDRSDGDPQGALRRGGTPGDGRHDHARSKLRPDPQGGESPGPIGLPDNPFPLLQDHGADPVPSARSNASPRRREPLPWLGETRRRRSMSHGPG